MLGKAGCRRKGWSGAGVLPGPLSASGCVRGQWRREKGRFQERGLRQLVAKKCLPSPTRLWQPFLGLGVCSGPTLWTWTTRESVYLY